MRLNRLVVRLVAAGLPIVALAGCGTSSEAGAGNGYRTVPGTPGLATVAPSDRTAAPNLSGTTLDGKHLSLADLRGKVVVVNFWASWCGPCRAEEPTLRQVAQDTAAQGVTFLGVNEKDDASAARAFVADHGVPYPSIVDDDGSLAAGWPAAAALPFTFIVDRQGRIAVRYSGAVGTVDSFQPVVQQIAKS